MCIRDSNRTNLHNRFLADCSKAEFGDQLQRPTRHAGLKSYFGCADAVYASKEIRWKGTTYKHGQVVFVGDDAHLFMAGALVDNVLVMLSWPLTFVGEVTSGASMWHRPAAEDWVPTDLRAVDRLVWAVAWAFEPPSDILIIRAV